MCGNSNTVAKKPVGVCYAPSQPPDQPGAHRTLFTGGTIAPDMLSSPSSGPGFRATACATKCDSNEMTKGERHLRKCMSFYCTARCLQEASLSSRIPGASQTDFKSKIVSKKTVWNVRLQAELPSQSAHRCSRGCSRCAAAACSA